MKALIDQVIDSTDPITSEEHYVNPKAVATSFYLACDTASLECSIQAYFGTTIGFREVATQSVAAGEAEIVVVDTPAARVRVVATPGGSLGRAFVGVADQGVGR